MRFNYSEVNNYKISILSYVAWWLFWMIAHALILHRLNYTWQDSFIDSFISNLLLLLIGIVTQNTFRFYNSGISSRLYRVAICLVLAYLSVMLTKIILDYVFKLNVNYLQFISESLPVRFVFNLLMISFITIVSWLLYYLEQQNENNKRTIETEKYLRDAELAKLQLQMQPHFLFNSLNSISALAGSRPDEARKMIQQLSDFFRGTLKNDEQKQVTFDEEITHLKLYLEIEKVRFGHRLNIEFEIEEGSLNAKIPSLILQPVVENAIKFGLYDTLDKVNIYVRAKVIDGNLNIAIENPFDANGAKTKQGEGFGLNAIQRRLYLIYGQNNLVETKVIGNNFITNIQIPKAR